MHTLNRIRAFLESEYATNRKMKWEAMSHGSYEQKHYEGKMAMCKEALDDIKSVAKDNWANCDPLISIDTAKLAHDKGVDTPFLNEGDLVWGFHAEDMRFYLQFTHSMLQKILRDSEKLHVKADINENFEWCWEIRYLGIHPPSTKCDDISDSVYSTYEEALEEALIKALKLI